jgi:hypothetical protein
MVEARSSSGRFERRDFVSFGCDCATIRRSEASGGAVGQEPTQAVSVAVCVEDWRRPHEVQTVLIMG